jgi:multidrug efflux pump subunit AcrB
MLAAQLRNAFYGFETIKLQRGRDEVKVRVSYPAAQRRSLGRVEDMRVRTPTGDQIPFLQVAGVQLQRGYTTLRRVDRRSVITVSADVDEQIANAEEVLGELKSRGVFEQLAAAYPHLKVDLHGQRRQWSESLGSLKVFYPIALLAIFTILAGLFKSYLQPVIVMVAIPFGLVGAVIGHRLLGYDISIMSLFGMVALTGIVVNDALVLIDYVNKSVRGGMKVHDAAEAGALRRFRPIVLTTITTIAGMLPILLERSFQAQFLKPMVAAIVFGLAFATMLTLLVVPCLYLIVNDARRALCWMRTGRWPTPERVSPQARRARQTAKGDHTREAPVSAGADDGPIAP